MSYEIVELYKTVLYAPKDHLSFDEKREILNDIRKIMPPDENRWNFRYVIFTLALIALSVPGVAVWLIWLDRGDIPQGLLSLGSTAVGALAAFLTPSIRRSGERRQTTPPEGTSEEIRSYSDNLGTNSTIAAGVSPGTPPEER